MDRNVANLLWARRIARRGNYENGEPSASRIRSRIVAPPRREPLDYTASGLRSDRLSAHYWAGLSAAQTRSFFSLRNLPKARFSHESLQSRCNDSWFKFHILPIVANAYVGPIFGLCSTYYLQCCRVFLLTCNITRYSCPIAADQHCGWPVMSVFLAAVRVCGTPFAQSLFEIKNLLTKLACKTGRLQAFFLPTSSAG